nr:ATP-binding protein [Candidatus Baldrarchaeota archaeon]
MSLYNEALTLKSLAEKALEKGDTKRASQYLQRAIKNLEMLELQTTDPVMQAIWRKAKKTLQEMLNNIDECAKEYMERAAKFPVIVRKTFTLRESIKPSSRISARIPRSREKVAVDTGRIKLPQECLSDIAYVDIPDTTFSDVAGLEDVKNELRESIEWQLKYPDLLKELNLKPLKGILLYGPPGTGKTYLVKAAAGEFKIPIIVADPASIMSKYVGESEKVVRKIFECARRLAPCIVFVDEIDKVLPLHTSGSDAPKRIEAQFLQEMDGIKSEEGSIVVFATNEPWNVSPALIRPGRIDRIIYVGPPDKEVRKNLFMIYLRNVPLTDDVTFDKLADLTKPNEEGYYSSSGIAQICNEAKKILMRRLTQKKDMTPLSLEDFKEAINRVPRSISHKMIKQYENWGLQHSSFA